MIDVVCADDGRCGGASNHPCVSVSTRPSWTAHASDGRQLFGVPDLPQRVWQAVGEIWQNVDTRVFNGIRFSLVVGL